jgi:hypothetical protein
MANGAKNGHAISLPDSSVPSTTMTRQESLYNAYFRAS